MASAKVNIPVKEPLKAVEALKPDITKADRFKVSITPLKDEVEIKITADDVSALRAAFNSYTRLLKTIKSMEEK